MKFIILLGDGMADEPLAELGGRTPLAAARTPNMDYIAAVGTLGLIDTIPAGMPPGSDVAALSVLGYDPRRCYSGRGPLEAASMGVALAPGEVALRCNLVTLGPGPEPVLEDFTAAHISTAEARNIIATLQEQLGTEEFHFYAGVGYRHLLVWRGEDATLVTTPPHDITGRVAAPYLPQGAGAARLRELMVRAAHLLADHPVNRARLAAGKRPANAIWPWGQGTAPALVPLTQRFGLCGGVITAVDLLRGIGVYAGLEIIPVAGATGYTDTNYCGKAEAALAALARLDFIFVHVEAPDEMGHAGNVQGKIKAIEDFDHLVVGTVLASRERLGDFRLLVLSDHPTPIRLKTHSAAPSPFAVLSSQPQENRAAGQPFCEAAARRAGLFVSPGYLLMEAFLTDWRKLRATYKLH